MPEYPSIPTRSITSHMCLHTEVVQFQGFAYLALLGVKLAGEICPLLLSSRAHVECNALHMGSVPATALRHCTLQKARIQGLPGPHAAIRREVAEHVQGLAAADGGLEHSRPPGQEGPVHVPLHSNTSFMLQPNQGDRNNCRAP